MRVLLVTSRYPWPPRRGDQLRAVQFLDLLAPEHEVTLLAPRPRPGQPPAPPGRVESYEPAPAPVAALPGLARALLRGMPLQSGLFFQPDLRRQLRRLAPRADLVVLQLARLALHLGDTGDTPVAIDLVDSLALNFARRAAVDRAVWRPGLRLEASLLARAERVAAERASKVLLVCERDREAVARRLPAHLAGRVVQVGLAVDPAFRLLAPAESPARGGCGAEPILAFTGNLGYFVNADAVRWFVLRVWPGLRAARPGLRLVVAGDRPRPALKRLLACPGVELIESPPALDGILARSTIALAPLRCGSGVPIKILEAWSAGVPVVSSPWAAAGTSGLPGEDLQVAGQPVEWVASVLELLADAGERSRLVAGGSRRLGADYSRQVVRAQLFAALG